MSLNENERMAVILHYAGIAAEALRETDKARLTSIAKERLEIETCLDMTSEEIIQEARDRLSRRA